MTLIISATPKSQWQSLIPLLQTMGWDKEQQDPESENLQEAGVGHSRKTDKYLLLHTRPELAIAKALSESQEPLAALDRWQAAAEKLLAFYKRNRQQAAVVEVTGAQSNPQALLEWLTQNHPAFANEAPQLPEAASEALAAVTAESTSISDLNLLLATQLVAQTPALAPLLAQLEASSIPLTENHYSPPKIDASDILGELQKQKLDGTKELEEVRTQLSDLEQRFQSTESKLASKEKTLKEENELLLNQLHDVQEELEKYYLQAQEGNQSLHASNEQIARLHEEIKQTELALAAAKAESQKASAEKAGPQDEHELALKQLFQVQEELEKYYLDAKTKTEQLKDKDQQLKSAIAELENAKVEIAKSAQQVNSTNEVNGQSTDQLRAVEQEAAAARAELAAAEAEQKNLKEENDLILKQLFQIQEELESYYIENQELKTRIQNQNDQIQSKNEKLRRFSGEKKALKQENRELRDEIERSREVFEALSQSQPSEPALYAVSKSFRNMSRANRRVTEHVKLVQSSEYFDEYWYLLHYPDVAGKFPNPAEHFVRYGGLEGRDPGPKFSSRGYLKKYPDVADTGQNPLVHYLLHGQAEGRKLPTQ